jgi:deazaflavin-dependent oxidoreductase (nitroreductase family)
MSMSANTLKRTDPAEQSALMRLFYRDWRPTRLGRIVNGAWSWWVGQGLPPRVMFQLRVRGRRTGRMTSTVLVDTVHDDAHYLVSMLGERSEWVKNVRAANGRAVIRQGRRRKVTLTEIAPEERVPILQAYAQVATSGRRHFPVRRDAPLEAFAAIAADYPVFRIDPRPRNSPGVTNSTSA